MRRYPGNFTDSDLLSIPRTFKARPWAPEVNLAYVTKDEEKLLQKLKPDTPHEGPEKVPSYDSYGTIVGGKDVGTGGGDVRDTGGGGRKDTYREPAQVYGKGAVPEGKRQLFTHETIGHQPWIRDLIKNIDPKTLAFWWLKQGDQTIPQELYQSLMQGSIVSGNEAVQTKYLYDKGLKWGSGDDVDIYPITGEGISVGTFNSIQAGEHPMFPGGLKDYYSDMAPGFYTGNTPSYPIGGGGGGGGPGPHYGGGYGGDGGGYGGGGGYGPPEKFTPRGNPNELWGQQNPLQQMMINIHGGQGFKQGFARGGIVSLVT